MAATAADLSAYRQAQRDVVALAYREIRRFWNGLDMSDPVGAVRALEAFLPELLAAYGEIGASVAADFYDELRERSPAARRAYSAVMGDAIPLDEVRRNVGWAVKPMFQTRPDGHLIIPDPDETATLGRVVSITDRLLKANGRRTIEINAERDPARARWARVPSGSSTCAFCLVMASRGAVYTSEATAAGGTGYHGHCDCVPTPIWDGDPYPEGYDPDALADAYRRAKREAESDSLKGSDGILAALRKEEGIR